MGVIINRRATFFLGVFIFLVPFMGLPSSWKTFLIVISALVLIALSITVILPTVITSKLGNKNVTKNIAEKIEKPMVKQAPKVAPKRRVRKSKTETVVESIPTYLETEKLEEIE